MYLFCNGERCRNFRFTYKYRFNKNQKLIEEAEGSEPIDEEPKDEEPKDEEPTDEEPTDEEPSTKPTEGSNDNVKTGDSSTHPYILIIGVVAFGTAVAMTRKKKISE